MQRITSTLRPYQIVLIVLSVPVMFLIGLAIPYFESQVPLLVLLIIAAFIVLLRPEIGLLFTVAMLPTENVLVFGEEITAVRLLGIFVAGAWAVGKISRKESWKPLFSSMLFKTALPLFFLIAVSTLWSTNPSKTYDGLFQLTRMILLSFLVMDLVKSHRQVDWLIRVLVLGGLVAAPLVLYQFFVEGAQRAGSDVAGGVNGTASTLVLILQFAFYLIRYRGNRFWRWVATLYVVLAIVAILVTFSRTSYLFLAVVFAANYWESIKNPRLLISLVITIVAMYTVYQFLPDELIRYRVSTISSYTEATFSGEGEETTARGFAWRVGLAMFRSNPVLGVGYGTFNDAYRFYRDDVKAIVEKKGTYRSAHSVYVSILAELGLIGIVLWLVLLFNSFPNLYRSYRYWSKTRSTNSKFLIQAVIYAFVIEVAYGWAVNISTSKLLWLVMGLIPIVLDILKTEESERPAVAVSAGMSKSNGSNRNGMRALKSG